MPSAKAALQILAILLPIGLFVGCGSNYCDTGDTGDSETGYQGARHRGPDHGWRLRELD